MKAAYALYAAAGVLLYLLFKQWQNNKGMAIQSSLAVPSISNAILTSNPQSFRYSASQPVDPFSEDGKYY